REREARVDEARARSDRGLAACAGDLAEHFPARDVDEISPLNRGARDAGDPLAAQLDEVVLVEGRLARRDAGELDPARDALERRCRRSVLGEVGDELRRAAEEHRALLDVSELHGVAEPPDEALEAGRGL